MSQINRSIDIFSLILPCREKAYDNKEFGRGD